MRTISDSAIPIHTWADDLEPGALEQARNCARLSVAFHHVALMPDAHQGYGVPIGAVLALDQAISPYAVGNDIGCGMAVVPTDVAVDDLVGRSPKSGTGDAARRDQIMRSVQRSVPADTRPGAETSADADIDPVLHRAFDALSEAAHATAIPVSTGQSWDPSKGVPLTREMLLRRGRAQLGSLGSGNHFVELLAGPAGNVWLMLHSGSRGVGSLVCNNFHRMALASCRSAGVSLPDPGLAWLPTTNGATDAQQHPWERAASCYQRALQAALQYAQRNRATIMSAVASAIEQQFPRSVRWSEAISIHHNDAMLERHCGKAVWVHRKGAVKAAPGTPTITPGSMGTGSYVGRGLGQPLAFASCSHGAGRVLSRGAARRALSLQHELEIVREGGGKVFAADTAAVIDEMPSAYKNLDAVMAAQADLVEPTCRLTPLATYKGTDRGRGHGKGWRPTEEQ